MAHDQAPGLERLYVVEHNFEYSHSGDGEEHPGHTAHRPSHQYGYDGGDRVDAHLSTDYPWDEYVVVDQLHDGENSCYPQYIC